MPLLNRTTLSSSDKRDFVLNSVRCQAFGDISSVSSEFNVSRKTVYQTREKGLSALDKLASVSNSTPQVSVDEAQIQRAIISLSITGANSIRDVEAILPLIYPGVTRSFGYIQNLQIQAQKNAVSFNAKVNLSPVQSIAIDEVYCKNDPVLAGIDLDSGFLTLLAHEQRRDGETWARVLEAAKSQGMSPSHIVKDGATGMTKGVNTAFPNCQQRDDAFHALYITSKSVFKTEKRAYRLIAKEAALEAQLKKLKNSLSEKADIEKERQLILEKCKQSIEHYEFAARGYRLLHKALRCVHTVHEIGLMHPSAAQSLLTLAAHLLELAQHPDCDSAARYITNRLEGLTLATDAFYQEQLHLCEQYPQDLVALASYFFEYKRGLKKISQPNLADVHKNMLAAYHHIYTALPQKQADKLMKEVELLLHKRHRASSAIEGFNALLRPYMYVRKGVSQGFLELFMAWHNLRTRRSGKHKGTSAYQLLTGKPVNDWLTMLGFPPSNNSH